jgi:hypothetical protein
LWWKTARVLGLGTFQIRLEVLDMCHARGRSCSSSAHTVALINHPLPRPLSAIDLRRATSHHGHTVKCGTGDQGERELVRRAQADSSSIWTLRPKGYVYCTYGMRMTCAVRHSYQPSAHQQMHREFGSRFIYLYSLHEQGYWIYLPKRFTAYA